MVIAFYKLVMNMPSVCHKLIHYPAMVWYCFINALFYRISTQGMRHGFRENVMFSSESLGCHCGVYVLDWLLGRFCFFSALYITYLNYR